MLNHVKYSMLYFLLFVFKGQDINDLKFCLHVCVMIQNICMNTAVVAESVLFLNYHMKGPPSLCRHISVSICVPCSEDIPFTLDIRFVVTFN